MTDSLYNMGNYHELMPVQDLRGLLVLVPSFSLPSQSLALIEIINGLRAQTGSKNDGAEADPTR